MPRLPFGNLGNPLTHKNQVSFSNVRTGVISAQELVVAGGTNGVVRSQNYDPTNELGWAIFGDGSAFFFGDITIGEDAIVLGDVYSSVWDGSVPADLSSGPVSATTGFYLDSSAGAIQAQELFVGGADGNLILQSFSNIGSVLFNVDELNFEAVITSSLLDLGGDQRGTLSFSPAYDSGSRVEFTLFSDSNSHNAFASFATFEYLIVPEGNVAQPGLAFNNNGDTGLYISSGALHVAVDGGAVARFLDDRIDFPVLGGFALKAGAGSASSPAFSFAGDPNTGLYRVSADNMAAVAGGSIQAQFRTVDMRLPGINLTTTGSAANTFVNSSNGVMARSTSSLKYKEGWQFADEAVLADLELPQPIVWEDSFGGTMLGFGTEHVHAMLEAATQDDYENYDVRSLVAIISAKVKRLEREVAALS